MDTTPEIEATLEQLTRLCCDALNGESEQDFDRINALTRNLSTNGWRRHSTDSPPLSTVLKNRIKDECREPAMHRGAEIDGIVEQVQAAYDKASRMETSNPRNQNQPHAISPQTE